MDKSAGRIGDGGMLRAGVLHLRGQSRIDSKAAIGGKRDKALREIDVSGRERCVDFAFRHVPVKRAVERLIADS